MTRRSRYSLLLVMLATVSVPSAWASDFCFNFRASSGYVTDPTGCTPVLDTDLYPHPFTLVGGGSVTGGWVAFTAGNSRDRDNVGDARLAGINYLDSVAARTFQVDLDAAESKDIVYALGDNSAAHGPMTFVLNDNGTPFDSLSSTSTTGADSYIDAAHTVHASEASWVSTGSTAKITHTFSTTAFTAVLQSTPAADAVIAHLRITTTPAAGGAPMRSLLGVGK